MTDAVKYIDIHADVPRVETSFKELAKILQAAYEKHKTDEALPVWAPTLTQLFGYYPLRRYEELHLGEELRELGLQLGYEHPQYFIKRINLDKFPLSKLHVETGYNEPDRMAVDYMPRAVADWFRYVHDAIIRIELYYAQMTTETVDVVFISWEQFERFLKPLMPSDEVWTYIVGYFHKNNCAVERQDKGFMLRVAPMWPPYQAQYPATVPCD